MESFEGKLTRRVKWKRMSFITQFRIEFLLPFTGRRKVLGKMPDLCMYNIYIYCIYVIIYIIYIFFIHNFCFNCNSLPTKLDRTQKSPHVGQYYQSVNNAVQVQVFRICLTVQSNFLLLRDIQNDLVINNKYD